MKNNPNFISKAIMGFVQELISEIYSDDEIHTKKDDNNYSADITEDLGYAVVVEDENRQTKLIN
jgi:hypothetical protein